MERSYIFFCELSIPFARWNTAISIMHKSGNKYTVQFYATPSSLYNYIVYEITSATCFYRIFYNLAIMENLIF